MRNSGNTSLSLRSAAQLASKRAPTADEAKAELARRHHEDFISYLWQRVDEPFKVGPHTKAICERLDRAVEDFRKGKSTFLAIKWPFGHGKLIADNTPVLTPTGWKRHGDLCAGDYVFGRDGKPVRVLGESSPDYADYEVVFSDGSKIRTHWRHEWVVFNRRCHKEVIKETRDMAETVTDRTGRPNYLVDHNQVIDFSEKQLPIHPYVFGVWLGNGTRDKNCITHDKKDVAVIKKIKALGYERSSVCVHNTTGVHTTYFYKLYADLVSAGFLGKDKHIPEEYLFASIEQRLELLAGLVDTDGYVNREGAIVFSNTNEAIISGATFLANSLGCRTTVSRYEPRTSSSGIVGKKLVYQLKFVPYLKLPTALKRKAIKYTSNGKRKRGIMAIHKCKPEKGKCIQVEGGVYLVGKTNVPTHNSDVISRYFPPRFVGLFPESEVLVTSYTAQLVEGFSADARKIMRDDKYRGVFPGIELSQDNIAEWQLKNHYGKVHWAGLTATVTGKRGALIIVDDFIKGREKAESEVERSKVWNCFSQDVLTRRAPVTIVIVLATPWHVDDVFGRIKSKMQTDKNFPRFEEYKYPAWTDTDEGTRQYLFTERYDESWYLEQEATLGAYGTASLLLCDPVPQHGNMFRVDKINEIPLEDFPEDIQYARGWDLASSEKQLVKDDPDFTVGAETGIKWVSLPQLNTRMPILYIRDLVRGRWEAPKRDEIIKQVAIGDGVETPVGIETFGAYKDAYTAISNALAGVRSVRKMKLAGDKVTKWSVLQPIFEAGNVYIPKNAPWKQAFIDELKTVPGSKHDDIADAITVSYYLHSPYQVHVFESVPKGLSFKIAFNKLSRYSTLCLSQWVEPDFTTSIVAALWNSETNQLWIYDELVLNTAMPEIVGPSVLARQKAISKNYITSLNMFAWHGNNLMFARQKNATGATQINVDGMWAAYNKRGISVQDNPWYDEYGAILLMSRLIADNRMIMHSRTAALQMQLGTWCIEEGKPVLEGFGLARAACNLVSVLSESGKMTVMKPRVPSYSPIKEQIAEQIDRADRAGMLGEYLANSGDIDYGEDNMNPDDWMRGA